MSHQDTVTVELKGNTVTTSVVNVSDTTVPASTVNFVGPQGPQGASGISRPIENKGNNRVLTFLSSGLQGESFYGESDVLVDDSGNLILAKDLTVSGDLAVSGSFTLGDSTTDKITTKGDLFVEDDAFFGDAVHITGDLTVDGTASAATPTQNGHLTRKDYVDSADSTITSNLIITGSGLHRDIRTVSGDLVTTAANLVTTGSNLDSDIRTVSGDLVTTAANLATTGQNLKSDINELSGEVVFTTGEQTNIQGNKTFANNVSVLGNLSVSGDFTLGDETTDKITTRGDLYVDDDAFFGDDVTVTGDLKTRNIYPSSNGAHDIGSPSLKYDNLYAKTAHFDGNTINLGVGGARIQTSVGGNVNLVGEDGTVAEGLTENPSIKGSLYVQSGAYITGNSIVGGGLTVTGNVSSPSSPSQNQHLTRKDYVDSADSILTTNLASSGLNLETQIRDLSGDAVFLTGNQNVQGNKTFSNNVTVLGDLAVSGDFTLGDSTTDKITTRGDLFVEDDAFFADAVHITGDLTVDGTASAANPTQNGHLTTKLYVDTADSTLTTNLASSGSNLETQIRNTGANLQAQITSNDGDVSTLTSNLSATGSNLQTDIRDLSGDAVFLTGNQSVQGNKTFSNNVTVLGDLAVSGDFELGDSTTDKITTRGDLFVEDDAFFADAVHITGDLTVDGTASAATPTQNAHLTRKDYVDSADSTLTTNLAASGTALRADIRTLSGQAVFNTGNQNIDGVKQFQDHVTIAGNLTVDGTTVTVNTSNVLVEDPVLYLAKNQTGVATLDAGFIAERGNDTNVGFIWDESEDHFATINTTEIADDNDITIQSYANFKAANTTVADLTSTNGALDWTRNSTAVAAKITQSGTGDILNLFDGASKVFTVLKGGNVGVGVASPLAALHVGGSMRLGETSNIEWNGNTNAIYGSNSNNYLGFKVNNTEALRIVSGGSIGIGTSSPTASLHIETSDDADGMAIKNGVNYIHHLTREAGNVGLFRMYDAGTLKIKISADGYSYFAGGNFGVATTNPAYSLDVSGTARASSNLLAGAKIGINNTAPSVSLDISATDAIKLPVGTTAQRPSAADGLMRLNTTTNQFEGYQNGNWQGLGGVIDVDQDTYVSTEKTSDDDTLFFYTGGSERVRIKSDGNVGIGTGSPTKLLHVQGSSPQVLIKSSDATDASVKIDAGASKDSYLTFAQNGSAKWAVVHDYAGTDKLSIYNYANNANTVTFLPDGNVGIGTTSPTTPLHVVGNTVINGTLFFDSTANSFITRESSNLRLAGENGLKLQTYVSGWQDRLTIIDNGNVGIGTNAPAEILEVVSDSDPTILIRPVTVDSANSGKISYRENAGGTTGVDLRYDGANNKFIIDTSDVTNALVIKRTDGNVGIGTTTPSNKLDINGGLEVNGESYIRSTSNVGLRIQTTDQGITNSDGLRLGLNGTHAFLWVYENKPLALATNGAERATILGNGNFGIGTTSPDSNLDIEGTGSPELRVTDTTNTVGAYIQSNDTKTIFGSRTNHPVQIEQNAGAALYIDTNKNVGIGTNNPVARLHVHETTAGRIQLTNGTSNATASDGLAIAAELSTRAYFWLYENAYMQFATNNAERMRITADGKVGIGTTSPNAGSWSNALTIQGASSTALELMKGSSLYAFMGVQGSGSDHALDIAAYQSQPIRLRVGSNAGTTAVTVTSAGSVGIGITAPTSTLHVVGTALVTSTANFNGSYTNFGGGSGSSGASIESNGRITTDYRIGIGTTTPSVQLQTTGDVIVGGNLTVSGTTFTVDTSNVLVEDPVLLLAKNQTGGAALDAGFIIERGDDTNVGFIWDESADQFAVINTTEIADDNDITIASYAAFKAGVTTLGNTTVGGWVRATGEVEGNNFEMLDSGGTGRTLAARYSGNQVQFGDGTTFSIFRFNGTQVIPHANATATLGTSGLRWNEFYSVAGNFSGTLEAASGKFTTTNNQITIFSGGTQYGYWNQNIVGFKNAAGVVRTDSTTDLKLQTNSTDRLSIDGTTGAATFTGAVTANAGINIDNINIDGTTIALSSSNLTLDVAGSIILDANSGEIDFKDNGVAIGRLRNVSSDFMLQSLAQDKDIIFRGNDGGVDVDALTLDMSDAGTAIFNHDITLPDSGKAIFGAGSDLQIYHDGSNSHIKNTGSLYVASETSGDLYLRSDDDIFIQPQGGENGITLTGDGAVTLYRDNVAKLDTTSAGVTVTASADNGGINIGQSSGHVRVLDFTRTATHANPTARIRVSEPGATHTSNMKFYTSDASGSAPNLVERMIIDEAGNVGIGTNAPSAPLHVNETDATNEAATVGRFSTSGGGAFKIMVDDKSAANPKWGIETGGGEAIEIRPASVSSIFCATDGKVGIGTTGPAVELDVAGVIQGQKFQFNDDTNTSIDTFAADQIGFKLGANNAVKWAFVSGAYGMQFMYGSGAAATPSYSWNSDQDTGMFNAATNALGFTTAGSERVRIDANGKVGIGTTAPANAVLVANHAGTSTPTNNIELMGSSLVNNGGTAIFLKASTNTTLNRFGARIHTVRRPSPASGGATDLVFSNENYGASSLDETMRITAEGNVGIGTATPEYPLHISDADSAIYLVGSDQGRIILQDTGATSNNQAFDIVSKEDKLHFRRLNNSRGSVQATVMALSGDKVGIGTTAPGSLLTIYEDDSAQGNTQLHIHNNKTDDAAVLKLEGKRTSYNDTGQVLFANNGTSVALIKGYSAGTDGALGFFTKTTGGALDEKLTISDAGTASFKGYIKIASLDLGVGWGDLNTGIFGRGTANTSSYLQFRVNGGTAAIHIDDDRNVGIGTNAPAYELDVPSGTVRGQQVFAKYGSNKLIQLTWGGTTSEGRLWIGNNDSPTILINGNSTSYINNGANFGIGTTAPGGSLHVYDNDNIVISDTSSASSAATMLWFKRQGTNKWYFNLNADDALSIGGKLTISTAGSSTFSGLITIGAAGAGYDAMFHSTTSGQYMEWDASMSLTRYRDNTKAVFGNGDDLKIYHNGTDSYIKSEGVGDLYIQQDVNDKDIKFQCDNGSGGLATYFALDGSDGYSKAHKKIRFLSSVEAAFGNSDDLKIWHDGTDARIRNSTGTLKIQATSNGENGVLIVPNGKVELSYDGTAKLATNSGGVTITGQLSATTKSFLIDHPTKPGKKLRHGSLEGPENGVYIRGKSNNNIIELPEYWTKLVDEDSITVQLTPIGAHQHIYVESVKDNKVHVQSDEARKNTNNLNYYYLILAERKDVAKMEIEE